MSYTDIEDGGMITPPRPTRRWSPHDEVHKVGTTYPFSEGAACGGLWDLYFPERDGPRPTEDTKAVTKVCGGCPIRQECIQWASDHNEEGIWGGTTKAQRRLLRKTGLR
jgi:WhiB family redox-sensing transcriptional regulator